MNILPLPARISHARLVCFVATLSTLGLASFVCGQDQAPGRSRPAVARTGDARTGEARNWPLTFRTASHAAPAAADSTTGRAEAVPAGAAAPSLTLPRAGEGKETSAENSHAGGRGPLASVTSVTLLAGGVLLVLWMMRRATPAQRGQLPADALEVLGQSVISPRLAVHLIRVGQRVVLVGSAPQSATALLEISEAEEVESLVAACRTEESSSVAASMRRVLHRLDGTAATTPLSHSRPRPRSRVQEASDAS
ncbi:MAG: flagellar biosynthetic protein FliO [Pirellulales bacterium]